ncbi:putative LIM domain-containing serine/threonine-protein kinase [Termitomyces sp. T112]|nr:putative LIM domain-containing serine/threonine-protein kinase [Termitomyces sp. T112]
MLPFEPVLLVRTESSRHCPTEHSDARDPESVTPSSSQILVTSRALPASLQRSANPVARGPAFSTSGPTQKRSRTSVPPRDQQTWTEKPPTLDPSTRLEHPSIPSHRLPSKPKPNRERRTLQLTQSNISSLGCSSSSHTTSKVHAPARPIHSLARPIHSLARPIHSLARPIHSLAQPATSSSTRPHKTPQSTPIPYGPHEGVKKGWSTTPSQSGTESVDQPHLSVSLSQSYHPRELVTPEQSKDRSTGPERLSLRNEVLSPPPDDRNFSVSKQPVVYHKVYFGSGGHIVHTSTHRKTSSSVRRCHSIRSNTSTVAPSPLRAFRHSSVPLGSVPFNDSTGMVLDNFVVNSAVTYSYLTHKSGLTDLTVAHQAHEWRNSVLPLFRDLEKYKDFLNYRGELAQTKIDYLQGLLDDDVVDQQFRVIVVVALSRLARKSELFPTRFFLHDVTRLEGTIAEGHFGAIQRGHFDGKDVCIKTVRLKISDARLYRRALSRELMAWAQISHENILPFYGICPLGDGVRFGIVAPFLKSGNVVDFLVEFPNANRRSLIRGIATGMSHLHENGIVHGDIKGQNVLVTDTDPPRAVLADFGLATVVDTEGLQSPYLSSNAIEGGTMQFEAPELLDPTIFYRRTTASDVYAFSMTVYQILSGEVPFHNKRKIHVPTIVLHGTRPSRPLEQVYRERGLDDFMWELINDCWHQKAAKCPGARKVLERLSKVVPAPCTQGWGNLSPPQFRNKRNLTHFGPKSSYT